MQYDHAIVIRCAGEHRFELYATPQHMPAHWQVLSAAASAVGADHWELLNIRAGVPVITAATSEAFVPQMANLELINGVSFTKGCYTGQEIVARMHYLGKLKQRMYHISIDSKTVPAAGDTLSAENAKATQEVGTIVSAQLAETGKVEALAVIQNNYASEGNLKLGTPDGPDVELLDLPYALKLRISGNNIKLQCNTAQVNSPQEQYYFEIRLVGKQAIQKILSNQNGWLMIGHDSISTIRKLTTLLCAKYRSL